MKVIVVGGGVVGLTTAICVLHDARVRDQRVELEIWAERVSPDVTSDVAGASFIPTEKHAETPRNRRWVADTGAALFAINAASPQSGVDLYRGTETLPVQQGAPWYLPLMAGPRRIQPNMPGIDPTVYASYEYTTPIVDMKVYLPWLLALAQRMGAVLIRRRVDSLATVQSQCDAVINCTGLGARWLVPDAQVKPLVGILVCVERSSAHTATLGSNFHRISLTDGEVAYIYPRRDMVVLGGTYLPLPDSALQRPGALDAAVTASVLQDHGQAIVSRCALLDPSVSHARVLGVKWGARPYRPEVRCELDGGASLLVHNYGHGGQGVLLSWGSAMEASRLMWSKVSPREPVPNLSIFQLLNSTSMSKL